MFHFFKHRLVTYRLITNVRTSARWCAIVFIEVKLTASILSVIAHNLNNYVLYFFVVS